MLLRRRGLASSAPSNKTSGSASGSRPTLPARPSRPRSTIPTPRCRPSTISPSSTCDLAVRPLGTKVLTGPEGRGRVIRAWWHLPHDYVRFISVRRSDATARVMSSHDVGVGSPLPKTASECCPPARDRLAVLDQAATTALADAPNTRYHAPPIWNAFGQPSRPATRHDQLAQRAETHVGYLRLTPPPNHDKSPAARERHTGSLRWIRDPPADSCSRRIQRDWRVGPQSAHHHAEFVPSASSLSRELAIP